MTTAAERPQMNIIAHLHNDFPAKFGLPRQSGLAEGLLSRIVFTPEYRSPQALRGITEFSHLWLIWEFSGTKDGGWHPTVRPPRLGGNSRVGVFATRSPFRPNPVGLSCVKLEALRDEAGLGSVLYVSGADMADGTPIYDIKPYLAFSDAHPDAVGGFAEARLGYCVSVELPSELAALIPADKLETLVAVLSQDPRPAYHNDPERVYGFPYAGFDIRFTVSDGVLTVREITPL